MKFRQKMYRFLRAHGCCAAFARRYAMAGSARKAWQKAELWHRRWVAERILNMGHVMTRGTCRLCKVSDSDKIPARLQQKFRTWKAPS